MLFMCIIFAGFTGVSILNFFNYLQAFSTQEEIKYLLATILFSMWALGIAIILFRGG